MNKLTKEQKQLGKELTKLQYKFVINLISGMKQRYAVKEAGSKAKSNEALDNSACIMLGNSKVKAFHDSLLSNATSKALSVREDAVKILIEIFKDSGVNSNHRIQAIKQISEMEGFNAPKEIKNEITGPDGKPLETITKIVRVIKKD